MKYVSGEITPIGKLLIGIKRGVINIRGNLTRTVKTMVLEGVSEGITERIRLKLAKDNAPTIIPPKMTIKFIDGSKDKKTAPKIRGIKENNVL
jgi:hypothetical protein